MPVLDTEVLFALDPKDVHHDKVLKLLASASNMIVPDTSLLEFVTVLKAMRVRAPERGQLAVLLNQVLDDRGVRQAKTIDALMLARQCELEARYDLTFYDSLIAASALALDQKIVSDDKTFDRIPGLERIPLG